MGPVWKDRVSLFRAHLQAGAWQGRFYTGSAAPWRLGLAGRECLGSPGSRYTMLWHREDFPLQAKQPPLWPLLHPPSYTRVKAAEKWVRRLTCRCWQPACVYESGPRMSSDSMRKSMNPGTSPQALLEDPRGHQVWRNMAFFKGPSFYPRSSPDPRGRGICPSSQGALSASFLCEGTAELMGAWLWHGHEVTYRSQADK